MNNLTRREVLKLAALNLGAPYLAAPHRAGALIQRSSFAAPPLLPLRRVEPGLIEAELTAAWTRTRVAGEAAWLATYNGSFPGPTLRVHEVERVRLRFTNGLDEPTNLHLHGLHVPPGVDNPFLMVEPGETVPYEFTIPRGSAGTCWYHPHLHGRVARQLFAGLAGAIVIKGRLDHARRLRHTEEHLVVLKDLTLASSVPEAHNFFDWWNGKEGELVLVNGMLQPVLAARRGTLRLRLLNASNARYYRLALEGHPLHLIATDGGFIAEPTPVDELLLAPGERAEVLVQLVGEGSFRLLNLPYDRGGHMMGGMHGGGMMRGRASQVLLTIVAPPTSRILPLPSRLADVDRLDAAQAALSRRLVLTASMMGAQFFIDGRTFDETRVDLRARLSDLEIWEIDNRMGMDHPFHLHTFPFQILSRNGVAEALTAWKDVVNVRANEVVRIAVPLCDFSGKTVYHCHIVEHEDRGMMGVLEVQSS